MPNPRAFVERLHFKHGDTIIEPDRNRGVSFAPYDVAPTPSVEYRGLPFILEGGAGTADQLRVVLKDDDDAYTTHYVSLSDSANTTTTSALPFIITGFGSEITDGIKGDLYVPFAHTITEVTAFSVQTGSIQADLWRSTYNDFPPTDSNSITASAPIVIDSSNKSRDTTLTGWSVTGAAGSIYRVNVDSCTTIQQVTLTLTIQRVNT